LNSDIRHFIDVSCKIASLVTRVRARVWGAHTYKPIMKFLCSINNSVTSLLSHTPCRRVTHM